MPPPLQWLYSGHSENYRLSKESGAEICLPLSRVQNMPTGIFTALWHVVSSLLNPYTGNQCTWPLVTIESGTTTDFSYLIFRTEQRADKVLVSLSGWKAWRYFWSMKRTVGFFVCLHILGCIPDSDFNMADKIWIFILSFHDLSNFSQFCISPRSICSSINPLMANNS